VRCPELSCIFRAILPPIISLNKNEINTGNDTINKNRTWVDPVKWEGHHQIAIVRFSFE